MIGQLDGHDLCEKCGVGGAINVRFLDESDWHLLCPSCNRDEAIKRMQERERAAWNVDAALGKTYDYKLANPYGLRKTDAATPRERRDITSKNRRKK